MDLELKQNNIIEIDLEDEDDLDDYLDDDDFDDEVKYILKDGKNISNVEKDNNKTLIRDKFLKKDGTLLTFDDVIGYQNIKDRLNQTLSYIKNVDKYNSLGIETPKGIFLLGEPGIGKTMLSKAFINQSDLPYYTLSACGESTPMINMINKTFNEALKNYPCVILLDDIDKFSGKSRDKAVYHVLQTNIDKVRDFDIYIIATANSDINIPMSLLRSGRFDTHIDVHNPTNGDRILLLNYFLKDKKIDSNIKFDDLSCVISSCTPVEMKKTINTTLLIAANENKEVATIEDFLEAFLETNYKDNKWKSNKNLLETAFHEAGHAVVEEALESNNIAFITVIQKGSIGGRVIYKKSLTKPQVITTVSLAGKASVELNLPLIASGCEYDIKKSNDVISDALEENASYGYSHNYVSSSKFYSDSLQAAKTEKLSYYERVAKHILLTNKNLVKEIVKVLLDKGYILQSEFKTLVEKLPIDTTFSKGLI